MGDKLMQTNAEIIVLFILLCLSSFFSASETALMSLSKIRVRHLVDENIKNAEILSKLIEKPSKLLGAILVGNNIVNIGASSLATSVAIDIWGSKGVGLATGVITLFVLIFGEITPKSIATKYAEKISLKVARVMYIITVIFGPIVAILMKFTGLLVKIFGVDLNSHEPSITEAELKTIMSVSHEEGVLQDDEKDMILNVFEFADNKVSDVMTPKINMVIVDVNSTYEHILEVIRTEQFSRLPVYEESHDNIIGILYLKDFVLFQGESEEFRVKDYMKQAHYTYEFIGTAEVFSEMRANRASMAIVLDEYGNAVGLATIEDLVEEIVGDIVDEYDENEEEIVPLDHNEYKVEGSTRIVDINDTIGTTLSNQEFDTIGGYIIGILGRLPEIGEEFEEDGIKFIIENIEKNRVQEVKIII